MREQWQTEFEDLYVDEYILDQYYNVMAYKYVIENISDYIDISNIKPYYSKDTVTIKVWWIKDLVKRAKKEWYTFKEIKELNPWILWDVLPKWKWEIQVYSK